MDIFTHTLSGIAAASAIAAFSSRPPKDKFMMICCGAAGALLPDLDAVTRWSGFDTVIGKALDLGETGRTIYSGHHWYSHHHFMHSLAAAALFTLAGASMGYYYCRRRSRCRSASTFILGRNGFLLSFFFGYLMHLLGDLPTPDSVWKGIRLYWPLATPVGGYGYIWWWNNYDILLIFLLGGAVSGGVTLANHFLKRRSLRFIPALLFLSMVGAGAFQISHRPNIFSSAGNPASYAVKEQQSQLTQRKILGEKLYTMMNTVDRKIPIPF
jgi:inner membrane protein